MTYKYISFALTDQLWRLTDDLRLQNQQGNWIFEDKIWRTFPKTEEGEDFIEVNTVGLFCLQLVQFQFFLSNNR